MVQKSPSPAGQESLAALRRLKLLVVVLVTSNLLLGAFSVYLLRRTDTEYSALLDQSVPLLYQVRTTGGAAGRAFRALVAALVTNDPVKFAGAVTRTNEALAQGKQLRAEVLATDFFRLNPYLAQELREEGAEYEKGVADILSRTTVQSTAEDERDQLERLQLAYDRYGAVIEKISETVVDRAKATSDAYTARTHSRSAMVLGLAGWPLLLGAAIAMLTVVVVMLFVFRQAGAGEGP
jgi:hypothetical protein